MGSRRGSSEKKRSRISRKESFAGRTDGKENGGESVHDGVFGTREDKKRDEWKPGQLLAHAAVQQMLQNTARVRGTSKDVSGSGDPEFEGSGSITVAGSSASLLRALGTLEEWMGATREELRVALEKGLNILSGYESQKLEETKEIGSRITELLMGVGLRLRCPREGCGYPGVIRGAASAKESYRESGVFMVEHLVEGKRTTHQIGSRLPAFVLVAAPADRRRKTRSS